MSTLQTNTMSLVRHGENTANLTKEFSYKLIDYSLTAKGREQARQTAEFFKDKQIHEIYTSPLKRARETADILAEALGVPVTVLEQLREVNMGTLEGQPPTQQAWALHKRIVTDWFEQEHYESGFPGGENYLSLMQRMQNGLLEITRKKDGRNIVLVGHGNSFKVLLHAFCQQNAKAVGTTLPNGSVTEMVLYTTYDGQLSGTVKGS